MKIAKRLKNKKDAFSREYQRERKEYLNMTKEILKALAMGIGIVLELSSPQGTRRFLKGVSEEWNQRSTKRALERLREKKLVGFHETNDGAIDVLITQEGRRMVKEWNLETLKIEKPRRWDDRWRVVAFDIAEKRKRAREAMRGMLKQLGFYQLQKSVFVHPYSCEAEIELIKKNFHIPDQEVLYFSTDIIPREVFLKNKFSLI